MNKKIYSFDSKFLELSFKRSYPPPTVIDDLCMLVCRVAHSYIEPQHLSLLNALFHDPTCSYIFPPLAFISFLKKKILIQSLIQTNRKNSTQNSLINVLLRPFGYAAARHDKYITFTKNLSSIEIQKKHILNSLLKHTIDIESSKVEIEEYPTILKIYMQYYPMALKKTIRIIQLALRHKQKFLIPCFVVQLDSTAGISQTWSSPKPIFSTKHRFRSFLASEPKIKNSFILVQLHMIIIQMYFSHRFLFYFSHKKSLSSWIKYMHKNNILPLKSNPLESCMELTKINIQFIYITRYFNDLIAVILLFFKVLQVKDLLFVEILLVSIFSKKVFPFKLLSPKNLPKEMSFITHYLILVFIKKYRRIEHLYSKIIVISTISIIIRIKLFLHKFKSVKKIFIMNEIFTLRAYLFFDSDHVLANYRLNSFNILWYVKMSKFIKIIASGGNNTINFSGEYLKPRNDSKKIKNIENINYHKMNIALYKKSYADIFVFVYESLIPETRCIRFMSTNNKLIITYMLNFLWPNIPQYLLNIRSLHVIPSLLASYTTPIVKMMMNLLSRKNSFLEFHKIFLSRLLFYDKINSFFIRKLSI
eukprot:gnl/TRDRNA2_/TRDRNA2_178079_c0_seq4.p1 gnl/TRDRNA2_/TRDRNA2_178079_c0~~gnl/TRDRNA2_/TRDRNA2_178079_c0_seq4.p1  ORF type:complete len:589 (+),score=-56.37 gnl/TRDRNA2_/TRDRNA2_178079_c0_seq4:724-2490(+)